ncbi:hypothetical protein BCD_1144 (plasmid) [Borrelia crocidurae DOU]|uniref:Uncharacterized protein n=1 Tax=Borrelia crocidurae DOU TaxID=1293575 RepID=W5SJX7_9SPIR|nr:hypothetical protein BCD_1144 [Borrelia crocidurae DOU]
MIIVFFIHLFLFVTFICFRFLYCKRKGKEALKEVNRE